MLKNISYCLFKKNVVFIKKRSFFSLYCISAKILYKRIKN